MQKTNLLFVSMNDNQHLSLHLNKNESIQLVKIECGQFQMGARGEYRAEEPVHRVVISQPFYLEKNV